MSNNDMSDNDSTTNEGANSPRGDGAAFEYVSGTLNAVERSEYERVLASSAEERSLVAFWEEELQSLNQGLSPLAPDDATWAKIAAATSAPRDKPRRTTRWHLWFQWATPALAALVLVAVMIGYQGRLDTLPSSPNTDYIAVLTNAEGEAVLTALTTENDSTMWLKWEEAPEQKGDTDELSALQLWAISKRDGQVRSLAVFEEAGSKTLALDEARFRLVSDSAFLILTREEAGGSALDEPSDNLIAKGVCVRFSDDEQA